MSSDSTASTSSSSAISREATETTVTSATSTEPVAPRREEAYDAFKRLKDCVKEISEFETKYADFDKVMHERDTAINDLQAIRDKLESKEKEIYLLKNCRKLDLEDLLAKSGKWKEEKYRMVKEHSSEKYTTKKELDSCKAKIDSLNVEVGRVHSEARLTQAQLEAVNQELAQWNAPISRLRPLDAGDLETKIKELSQKCAQVAHSYFYGDLPTDILGSHEAWENGIRGLNIPLGLPPDNSQPTKLMRVAVAMYVFSNELAKTVLRPCLLPDSKEQSLTIQETLEKYFRDDRRTRCFIQAQLLSTHNPEDRRALLHRWALNASVNASTKLSFMCPDRGTNFITRTKGFFQGMADLWCDLQYVVGDIKVITSDAYHFPEWEWDILENFGETSQSSASRSTEEAFMLFPGFYVQDRKIELFRGFALWKDQKHVEKAHSEWKNFQRTRIPDLGRASSAKNTGRRRYSISINAGPTPPSSPKSSVKEPHPQAYSVTRNK